MTFLFTRIVFQLNSLIRPRISSQSAIYSFCKCSQVSQYWSITNANQSDLQIEKQSIRYYAKGKDKKKSDKGKKKVAIDENQLREVIDVDKLHAQLQKSVDDLKDDYVKNLSLRSVTGSIETLPVKFEGKEFKLQELAQVIRQNPKSIIMNMSAFPQAIPAVLEAIKKSGMNLSPQQDGTKLFVPVPKVTKELREALAKNAKALFIKYKDHLKDTQIKFIKSVKNKEKTEGLSQDLIYSVGNQITAITDNYISQAEKVLSTKEAELKGDSN